MKGQVYVILGIIILIIASTFAVTNIEPVNVNFLLWKGETSLIFVILFSLLLGGLVTAFAGGFKLFQLNKENRKLRRENTTIKRELDLKQPGSKDNKINH